MKGVKFFIQIGVHALHIKNHCRKECKENYPQVIQELRELYEKPNTESAEQTFIWLGNKYHMYTKNL